MHWRSDKPRNSSSVTCGRVGLLALIAAAGVARAQNQPPLAPVIREPILNILIDPSDVHMETAPMVDPNSGDTHQCTDWQLVDVQTGTVVWRADCIVGPGRVHVHFGDGRFVGQWENDRTLQPNRNYTFRVRHSDSSDSGTRWSVWSERGFTTGAINTIFPLDLDDISITPPPRLVAGTSSYDIPATSTPHTLSLQSAMGDVLLRAQAGSTGNSFTNFNPLPSHVDVQVRLTAGNVAWNLPQVDVEVSGGDNVRRTILLPAVNIPAGETRVYWISTNGSTFAGTTSQMNPDLSTPVRVNESPWTAAPGYKVTPFASGLQLPVQIAFVPDPGNDPTDPFFYVTELYGDIKLVLRNGTVTTYAADVLNFPVFGDFPGAGEIGLAGICVDPTNGDVYATSVSAIVDNDPNAGVYARVFRFTSNDGGRTSATRSTIFFPIGSNNAMSASHQISSISLGTDNNLYVHVGDAFDADAGLNLDEYRGKILRMTKAGAAVPSNPFYSAANGISARDYVWAYGFRNPFGGAWRRSENALYFVENGPGTDRLGKATQGTSYGFDGSDESMRINALYNWQPAVAPVNIAFVESSLFFGSGFPESLRNRAFITQSGSTWASGPGTGREKVVSEIILSPSGQLLRGPLPVANYNGFGKSSASAIATGPDGLYFSELYKEDDFENPAARGSRIFKLSYAAVSDCNGNGIDDGIDIAGGISADCNTNLVPDECDISLGYSMDCNNTGLPDDCEAVVSQDYTFNTPVSGPWNLRGSAQIVNNLLRLTNATDSSGVGSAWIYPLGTAAVARWRIEFDFRMTGGPNAGRDLGVGIFPDSTFDETVSFGGNGPGTQLFMRFATADDGDFPANRVQVLNQDQSVAIYEPSFNVGDNQWRRVTVSYGPSGLSARVQTSPGVWEEMFRNVPVRGLENGVRRIGFGSRVTQTRKGTHEIDNIRIFPFNLDADEDRDYVLNSCECSTIDFNNDGLFPDDSDLVEFLTVLAGGNCSTGNCNSIDFNNDGLFPDDGDLLAFLTVLAGGSCN